jgi:circadian clock protein KaiC
MKLGCCLRLLVNSFREFLIGLTSFIKKREIAGLCTATSKSLIGGQSVSEQHISTLTDSIILLRYIQQQQAMHRGLMVLKMRGSEHAKDIRQFTIDDRGMHLGQPFAAAPDLFCGTVNRRGSGAVVAVPGCGIP